MTITLPRVVARLKPDVSLSSALSQVGALQYQMHFAKPEFAGSRGRGLLEDAH